MRVSLGNKKFAVSLETSQYRCLLPSALLSRWVQFTNSTLISPSILVKIRRCAQDKCSKRAFNFIKRKYEPLAVFVTFAFQWQRKTDSFHFLVLQNIITHVHSYWFSYWTSFFGRDVFVAVIMVQNINLVRKNWLKTHFARTKPSTETQGFLAGRMRYFRASDVFGAKV